MKRKALVIAVVTAMLFSLLPTPFASAAALSSITASPTTIAGGVAGRLLVRLSAAAPSGGQSVTLSSSNPAVATAPASVTVSANQSSATVDYTTNLVGSNTTVTFTATSLGVSRTVNVTVTPAGLGSVSVSPSTVINGRTGAGTVRLTGPAPAGGITVALASSNTSVATVPASVTVPAGSDSRAFTFTALSPATSTSVTVTASFSGANRTARVTVAPLALASIALASTVTAGKTLAGKINLNGTAGAGGFAVSLTSSNTSAATVPASVTVPAGASTADFTLTARSVAADTAVTITASAAGSANRTANVTVTALALQMLSVNPNPVTAGIAATGRVTLTGPAPTGGAVVAIANAAPSVATIPSTVTVPAGQTSATFAISTERVTTAAAVEITASVAGSSRSTTLNVVPATIDRVSLTPNSTIGGQSAVTGFVHLTGPAPAGGLLVQLSSDNTAAQPIPSVTVQAGLTSASFGLTTVVVSQPTVVTISASHGATTKSSSLSVGPLAVSTFLLPTNATGGNNHSWTMILNGVAPTGGIDVTLTSSNPALIAVPVTVNIPEGSDRATVTFTPAVVATSATVTLTATLGSTSRSQSVTVRPATFANIGLNSGIVTGGLNVTGTLLLTGPAPAGGITVAISIDNAIAQVPASVTVPAGKREVNFLVTTTPTATVQQASITATYDGITRVSQLTVNPPALRDIIPNPISVATGGSTTTTLRLTGPAPAGGTTVHLASSQIVYATAPTTVTVPAGQRSVQFQVTATSLAPLGTTMTLTATLNDRSSVALIQITELQLIGFTVSPASVIGGATVNGTLTINGNAPVNGAAIALQALDPAVTVPDAVTIVNGTRTVQFSIATQGVLSNRTVTIYATFNANTVTVDLTLLPLKPSGIVIEPSSIEGGEAATATVTLNGTVPPGFGALEMTLASSDPSAAAVPATVTIPEGSSAMTFQVTGSPVAAQKHVTISASYGGDTVTGVVTVNPPRVDSVSVEPATVTGGAGAVATVTLTSPAPSGGWQVTLSSSNAAATVQGSVTVAPGNTSATFNVSTQPVASRQIASISASRGGVLQSSQLTIDPPRIMGLSLSESTKLGGDGSVTGTINLSGVAPFGGWVVALSSSDTSVATVPASVTIPQGQSSITFSIATIETNTTRVATITATENGNTHTAELTVLALLVESIVINRVAVVGGSNATATITLNTGAPAAGAVINLASNQAAGQIPATVSFSAGQSTRSVTITTSAVSADVTAIFTASRPNSSVTDDLNILAPTPSSLAMSPTTVTGGVNNSTATLSLNGPAPAGGAQVALTYAGAGATGPASVTIPAGTSSATFTLTSQLVQSQQTLEVTATYNNTTRGATLTVNQHRVSTLSLNPSSVPGSLSNSTGTVTLNAAAPAGGTTVNLASSNNLAATVPATVVVPAGQTTATFTVTSLLVTSSSSVTITATYNGSSRTATLTVQPFGVTDLSLSPTSVIGGFANSTGTVTVGAPAGSGGTVVTLSSSNTNAATVPASVTVPQGQTTATFTVTSRSVSADTNMTITASGGGLTETATLLVQSTTVTSLALSPSNVIGGAATATGTITLNVAAPAGGIPVALSSSNASVVAVPASVTVPAGQTSVTFTVSPAFVSSTTDVILTATFNGSRSQTLTVSAISLNSLSVSPSGVTGGVNNATGTVVLSTAAPAGGISVALSSSNTSAATVPASVTVPAGQTSATFTVTSLVVSSSTSTTITATLNGSRTASLSVSSVGMSSLSLSPSSLVGGSGNVTGTVTLNNAAPAGGAVVALASNRGSAQVPASVTVPAGQSTATFTITTSSVGGSTTATITATFNGSATASLTLTQPTLSSLTVSPGSVTGSNPATGTVSINVPAPSGGIWVSLSDNSSAASRPSGVTIPGGSTSASFTITTTAVAADTTVTISASYAGSSVNGALVVLRPVLTSLAVSPTSLRGGNDATGTVTLSGPAPSSGMTVSLSRSSSRISIPSSVYVAPGATSATFDIETDEVSSNRTVTITASLNGVSRTADILLRE